ncbi:hypothetical protein N665_0016s0040, partial [Sinapis alba]
MTVSMKLEAVCGATSGEGFGSSPEVEPTIRVARPIDHEELVVGLEDDVKFLLAKLLGDDGDEGKRYINSIFGMGGLGKTALARKLYNLGDVKRRFDCRTLAYVSQEYNTRDIVLRIIRSLGVEEELEVYLHDLLDGKKYLVVVDDIWKQDAWESLRTTASTFSIVRPDQPILLSFESSVPLHLHLKCMLLLLLEQSKHQVYDHYVNHCIEALPLAIVVLAGLLSRKRPNEWHEVCASFWRCLKDNSIHISTVFDLSFNELHYELKLCFLYHSVFPEDYEIDVEKLIHLLVAEGFIQEDGEMTMEDVARHYMEELIDRSLLEAVRRERGKVVF